MSSPEVIETAWRIVATAIDDPESDAGRAYPRTLEQIANLLIADGVTPDTSDDVFAVKLQKIRTHHLRLFLFDHASNTANLENLKQVKFTADKIVVPYQRRRLQYFDW